MKTVDRGPIVGQDLFGSFVYEADLPSTPRARNVKDVQLRASGELFS